METFLIYIGKAALAAGAFYLLYRALFQHQKHFTFNRIYLPVSLALSFLIPLITFTSIRYIEATPVSHDGFAYLAENSTAVEPAFQWQWYHYLSAIYLLGALVFLLYLILGHSRAISIIRKSRLQKLFKVKVNVTFHDVHPFSFFNKIVLSEKTLKNPNLGMIVQHEEIHVRGKHTLDILFAEILFLFQWFNPFAWLLKDAIKNNLEYMTDHELTKTNDAQQYQLAMVGLAHKQGVAPFLTALNGSQLKNRIIMMKKKTENKYALLKQLVVLPLLAVLVMGLSNKEVKTEIVPAKEKMDIVVDGKTISTDDPAFKNLDFSKGFDGREIMLALGIEDNVILNGYTDETDPNTYFIQTSKYVLGTNPEFDELISNPEEKNKEKTRTKTLTAIDGKILSDEDANKLDGTEFESAVILSGDEAVQKYGEKAKDASVVDFKTGESNLKVYSNTSRSEFTVKGIITDNKGNALAGVAIIVKGTTTGTITDLDGNYLIKLENDDETLVFTMAGYKKKEVAVDGQETIDVKLEVDENSDLGVTNTTGIRVENKKTPDYKYTVTGKVVNEKGEPVPGTAVLIKGKTIGTISDMNGDYKIGCEEPIETLVFSMVGHQVVEQNVGTKTKINVSLKAENEKSGSIEIRPATKSSTGAAMIRINDSGTNEPLYVVDGKVKPTIADINPEDIESINVLKGESAEAEYGELGKNGVILITTKVMAQLKKADPLLFLDGEKYDGEIDDIDPENIESIEVLKDASSVSAYGEAGKNGVILVSTKAGSTSKNAEPLILINGEKSDKDVANMNADEIVSMSVFKGDEAVNKFGGNGEDGVIVITTKDYKLDTPDDLRKYIAQQIIYPQKAKNAKFSGIAEVAVSFDNNGDITGYADKEGAYAQNLEEVVVIGYEKTEENKSGSADKEDLKSEVRRVLKLLPSPINIPDFKGETVLVTVKFVLQ